ncbi:MAG: hypothetical protein QOJ53_1862 [Sphingomonadales bacterium]|jgi:hypothetical protein|nr:hypothetical protein [Sphingomonadales bacterium]MEA3043220.1 hypothetical protein [Sphingomonadales bacterium]MEA3047530.1 hypothetical protein [Sphingomonadales bacterium]
MDYIDKFKKFVPAEVLAAFVALNALMPFSQTGTWIYLAGSAVIAALFAFYAVKTKMFKNPALLLVVTLSVPLWGISSATARLEEEYEWFDTAKIGILAILVIGSLALTLFAPAPSASASGPAGDRQPAA